MLRGPRNRHRLGRTERVAQDSPTDLALLVREHSFVELDTPEILVGVAEIAVALAGFTGVVVAFGSRNQGTWHPGDRLRLNFLLEASLTAGAFALLALILVAWTQMANVAWATTSALWAVFMPYSLYTSHRRVTESHHQHHDVDIVSNRLTFALFCVLIAVQVINATTWHQFGPLLAALASNLAGAAMQFTRLLLTAFRD